MADITEPIAPNTMLDMEEFKQWKAQKEIKRREEQQRQEREQQQQRQQQRHQQQRQQQQPQKDQTFGERLVEDTSGSDSEGSAIGDFPVHNEKAIEDLLDTVNKAPLIEQMGFRSYKEDRVEYNKRRKMAADALAAKPVQFIIGSAWKSVRSKATRQFLIDKVRTALAQYNYSDSVCLAIIISLTNNKRRNKNRRKNKDITLAGGAVRKGRPPTTGHYVGRRRTTAQRATANNVAAVPMDTPPVSARPSIPVGAAVSVAQRVSANIMTIGAPHMDDDAAPPSLLVSRLNSPGKQVILSHPKHPSADAPHVLKTLDSYYVLVDKKHIHYQFKLDYEEFRKRWKGKDVWYRFPGKGKQQILLDSETRYHQFLTRVKESNEAPAMWEHSDADFQDDDDDASFYSMPPSPPPPPPLPPPPPPLPQQSVPTSTIPLMPTRRVSFDASVARGKQVENYNATHTAESHRTNAFDTAEAVLIDRNVEVNPEPPKKRGPGRPKGSLNKKKNKVAGTAKEKTPVKEKAKKTIMRTRSQDALQKEIDNRSASGVISQSLNQSDEVGSSAKAAGECDDSTYWPVRAWQNMSSSQVPPPSCGQPLLRVVGTGSQQIAPEPTPPSAQPQSLVFTQNSVQSSEFMPTQANPESLTKNAMPRLVPRMFTQAETQDYIREDGYDISRLSGLDDVFADTRAIATPPRRMGPPPMSSYMGSLKARRNVGRLSPMVPHQSHFPASTSEQPLGRLASRGRYSHLQGALSFTQPPMAGEEIVEVPVGKMLDLNSNLKPASLIPAPLMGSDDVEPMSYRKLLKHPELIPGSTAVTGAGTSFQRAKMLINQAAATAVDGQQAPAKRGIAGGLRPAKRGAAGGLSSAKRGVAGGLSNAQKKIRLAAMNRNANNEGSVVQVPETPFKI